MNKLAFKADVKKIYIYLIKVITQMTAWWQLVGKKTQKPKQNKNPETQGGPVSNVF